jgi:RimJ/RimL family protein N-acetyltransferase
MTGRAPELVLRDMTEADLPVFFEHQLDAEARHMAAFTPKDPADRNAFQVRWARILGDAGNFNKTVVVDGQVAGHVSSFEMDGQREVTYWLGRSYWGRGLATRALSAFLAHEKVRPLHARAAKDNLASLRVLQKCGFVITGEDSGFAHARGAETAEFILILRS